MIEVVSYGRCTVGNTAGADGGGLGNVVYLSGQSGRPLNVAV